MKMTTSKLIALRTYNILFGRFDIGRKWLRIILEHVAIKGGKYTASAKYFDQKNFQ